MNNDANRVLERFLAILGVLATIFSCYVGILALSRRDVIQVLVPFVPPSTPEVREIPVTVIVPQEVPVTVVVPQQVPITVAASRQPTVLPTATVNQQILKINKPMIIKNVGTDQSKFRAYFSKVDFSLSSVERVNQNSLIYRFSLWNHNSDDYLQFSSDRQTYVVSADGTKYNALNWDSIRTDAGERQDLVIAFNAPTTKGITYKMFFFVYAATGPSFTNTSIEWQTFDIILP